MVTINHKRNTRITSSRDRGITKAGQKSRSRLGSNLTSKPKGSGSKKLADYKAKHSSGTSKPTKKETTEAERKAKQLITSSVGRAKGEDRTKAPTTQKAVSASVINPEAIKDAAQKIKASADKVIQKESRDQMISDSIHGNPVNQAPKKSIISRTLDKIEEIDAKASEHVPTLKEVSAAGKTFREKHPKAADAIYNTANAAAGITKKNVNKDAGAVVGQFSVGMYDGVQKKPVSTAGKTVAWALVPGAAAKAVGSAGKAIGASSKVGSVARKVPTKAALKTAEAGLLGLYGAQMAKEIKAPTVTTIVGEDGKSQTIKTDPTKEQMAYRAGGLFGTDVVPMVAGLGAAKAAEGTLANKQMSKAMDARYKNPSKLTQVDGPRNARVALNSEVTPISSTKTIKFNPQGEARIAESIRRPQKLADSSIKFTDDVHTIKPTDNSLKSQVRVLEKGSKAKMFEFEIEAPRTQRVTIHKGKVKRQFELEVPQSDSPLKRVGRNQRKLKSGKHKESIWESERASVGDVGTVQKNRPIYERGISGEVSAERTIMFNRTRLPKTNLAPGRIGVLTPLMVSKIQDKQSQVISNTITNDHVSIKDKVKDTAKVIDTIQRSKATHKTIPSSTVLKVKDSAKTNAANAALKPTLDMIAPVPDLHLEQKAKKKQSKKQSKGAYDYGRTTNKYKSPLDVKVKGLI